MDMRIRTLGDVIFVQHTHIELHGGRRPLGWSYIAKMCESSVWKADYTQMDWVRVR